MVVGTKKSVANRSQLVGLGCGTKGGGTFDGGGQRDKMLGVQGKKLYV